MDGWKKFETDGWPPEGRQFLAGAVAKLSSGDPEEDGRPIWLIEVCDAHDSPDTEEYPFWMLIPEPKQECQ